jgi:hypothetical protein
MLLHAASDNKRVDQVVKCIYVDGPNCGPIAWDILCERLDDRSFARSLILLDNLMLRQRPAQSLTENVHFMRQTFNNYNETCEMINESTTIHPHHLRRLMLRGISCTCQLALAKQCVINAFDTNYLLLASDLTANILHLTQNMETELPVTDLLPPIVTAPPIAAFMAAGRGSHGGRGHPNRGGRGGRGLPNKCNACGSLDHILSSCTTFDATPFIVDTHKAQDKCAQV